MSSRFRLVDARLRGSKARCLGQTCQWLKRAGLSAVIIALASCARSPTAPSSVQAVDEAPQFGQQAPPVPPRLTFGVPTALGLTRFLAFGDSVTYGTLSSLDGRFLFDMPSHSYPARLLLGLGTYHAPQTFAVSNFGNPGEMVTQAVSRFQSVLTAERPQCVLLLEGVNDLNGGVSQQQISSALGQMLDRAALTSTPVLIATMFRIYEAEDLPREPARIVPFNDEIRRLAAGRLNVHVIDLYTAFGTDRTLIGGDGLHPTPEGYELMAATFLEAIEIAFAVRGSIQ